MRQTYSSFWSFSSLNLEEPARSMSKISMIPSTQLPSSLRERENDRIGRKNKVRDKTKRSRQTEREKKIMIKIERRNRYPEKERRTDGESKKWKDGERKKERDCEK